MINIIKSYKELFEDIEKAKFLLKSFDTYISIAEHQNRLCGIRKGSWVP